MKIAIGCDHTATELKDNIIDYLKTMNIEVQDLGTYNKERTDYPIYAKKVAENVSAKVADKGILICGTGVGMSMAANKFKGIRAVVCSEPYSAKAAVEHNNSNILCFGARVVGTELAKMIVKTWLNASYHGERHQKRVDMIDSF